MRGPASPEEELAQLAAANTKRMAELMTAGARVAGIGEHYLISLLEMVLSYCGPDALVSAKLAHERWLVPQLDQAEATFREMRSKAAQEGLRLGMRPAEPGAPQVRDNDLLQRMVQRTDTPLPKK
jgi:hypothetical protein